MFIQTSLKRELLACTLKKVFLGVFAVILIALVWANLSPEQTAAATSSSTINFQARLETGAGAIVSDGDYNVEFKLYSASSGGTAEWTEDYTYSNGSSACSGPNGTGDCRVHVANGYLTVNLGGITAFPNTIKWNQQQWLTMNIGGTVGTGTITWDGEMSPRLQLTAVPYAFSAGSLGYNDGTYASGLNFDPQSGNHGYFLPDFTGTNADICLSTGNCVGGGGAGSAIGGSGTSNTIAMFTGSGTIGNSFLSQTGSAGTGTVAINGNLTASGTGTNYIMGALGLGTANPQGTSGLTLANGSWISGVANGGGYVNMFQVNSNNEIQVGAALNIDGGIVLPTDGGQMTFSDLPIDSSASTGTKESYTLRVGSTNALTVYGESNGSGGTQNVRVAIGPSINPQYPLDVTGNINTSTGYLVGGTAGSGTDCSTGGQVLANIKVQGGIITGGSCAANGGGVAPTLQNAYDNSGTTPKIVLSSTGKGILIQDASSPVGGNLFAVQNNAGSSNYLAVTASGVSVTGSATVSNGLTVSAGGAAITGNLTSSTTFNLGNGALVASNSPGGYYLSFNDKAGQSISTDGGSEGQITIQASAGANGISGLLIQTGTTIQATGTSALQVTGSNGQLLNADTSNMRVSIGSIGTATGQLYVSGSVPTSQAGSASIGSIGNAASGVAISGRYAYVTVSTSDTLKIFDVSNPAAPVQVTGGSVATTSSPEAVYVQGHYAYIVGTNLQVVDVSNPASPVVVGNGSLGGGFAQTVYVQGSYAYIGNPGSNEIQIFDVSDPTNPVIASQISTGASSGVYSIYVQGRYAYAVYESGNTLHIFDVSDPTNPNPASIGSVATGALPKSVYVQGRYAYVVSHNANTLQIFDVSVPTAPVQVSGGSVSTGGSPSSVYVQGRYAYVADNGGPSLQIFDVSNPGAPVQVTSGNITTDSFPTSVSVVGRYAYIVGSTLQTFDVGGAYVQQLQVGGAEFGTLQVDSNANFASDASIQGGLNIGQSLQVGSSLSVNGVINSVSGYSFNGTAGLASTTCSSGEYLDAAAIQGGIVTGGSCVAVPSGSGGLGGSGTNGTIALFTGTGTSVGDSALTQSGSDVTSSGALIATTTLQGPEVDTALVNSTNTLDLDANNVLTLDSPDIEVGSAGSAVNVNGAAQFFNTATIKKTSGTAFLVQNGSSAALLTADTSNMRVSIGSLGTATGQLYVGGSLATSALSTLSVGTNPIQVAVQGHYLYEISRDTTNPFRIYDITNQSSPVSVYAGNPSSAIAFGGTIAVSGQYAYIGLQNGGNGIVVINIAKPAAPVYIGTTTTATEVHWITIQGRYMYIATYGGQIMQIFDLANPASPQLVGGSTPNGNNNHAVVVQGKYAYMTDWNNSSLMIYDVSNPTNPTLVNPGGGNGTATTGIKPRGIAVVGKYAYLAEANSSLIEVFDVSDPTNPTSITTVTAGTNPWAVSVQGHYLYVTNNGSNTIQVFNISNPTAPVSLGTITTGSGPEEMTIAGRYAYVANNTAGTVQIFDLGGAYIQQLEAGGAEFGTLQVDSNAQFAGNASIQGGLNIGQSLQVNSNVGINGSQFIQNAVAANDILTLQEAASQNGNLIQFNDSTGTQIGKIDSTGAVQLKSFKALATGSQLGNTNNYFTNSSNSSAVVQIQGHSASQTGDLLQLQNSSGNPMTVFNSNGDLHIGGTNSANSTSALLVQNTSSATLLNADTTNMALSLGVAPTTLGYTTVASNVDSAGGSFMQGLRIDSKVGGTVTSISVYVGAIDPTPANDHYQVAIYGDYYGAASGAPIATSGTGTLVANSWNTIAISASLSANTVYWLMFNTNASSSSYNSLYYDNSISGALMWYGAETYGSWPTLGTSDGSKAANTALSMYANVTPAISGAIHTDNTGNVTLSGNVGIGMPADAAGLSGNALNVGGSVHIQANQNATYALSVNSDASGNVFSITPTGQTTFQNSADSTTAFQIQNTSAATLLTADTTNMRINIGNLGTPTGQLYVSGALPSAATGSVNVPSGASGDSVAVVGKYAYATSFKSADSYLQVIDISNPSSPAQVGELDAGTNPAKKVVVQGHYAYLVGSGSSSTFNVVDVSVPTAPTSVFHVNVGSFIEDIYVSGRYAYLLSKTALYAYDISNPASPVLLNGSGLSLGSTTNALGLDGQGRYLYVATNSNSLLYIIDVSNPASPAIVNTGGTALGNNGNSIAVSGRYAYVINANSAKFQVFDLSTPTAPTSTYSSSTGISGNPIAISIQGKRAYIIDDSGALDVFDISDPRTPSSLGSATTAATPNDMVVAGRYAYVMTAGSLQIFDLGGAYTQQLEAGGIQTGSLQVNSNADFAGNASIQGGLQIGQSLQVSGNAGITGSLNVGSSVTTDTITLGGTAQTGTITLGQSTQTNTINIGNAVVASGKTQTINIGTGTTSGTENISIGSPSSTTGTTGIAGGTAVAIVSNNIVKIGTYSASGGTSVQTAVNSATGFMIQNADSTALFNVDTTADSTNVITNGSFEQNTTGWSPLGSASISQYSTSAFSGSKALDIHTTAAIGDGAKYPVSLSPTTTYTLSFYVNNDTGVLTTLQFGRNENGTSTDCNPNYSSTAGVWSEVLCTFTTGATIGGSPYIYIDQTDAVARHIYVDAVRLQVKSTSFASPYRESAITLNGVITSPVAIQPTINSNTAFSVYDSDGNSLFNIDAGTRRVTLSTSNSALPTRFLVGNGSSDATIGTLDTGTGDQLNLQNGSGTVFQVKNSGATTIQDSSNPQLTLSQSASNYTQFQTDSSGNLSINTSGDNITLDGITAFSDNFASTTLDPSWAYTDPNGAASYSLTADPGYLELSVPANNNADCWGTGSPATDDCVRVMHNYSNVDNTFITKVDNATLTSGAGHGEGYGILLWQDSDNYMRFEFHANTSSVKASGYSIHNGVGNSVISSTFSMTPGSCNYMKVVKTGTTYTMYVAEDASCASSPTGGWGSPAGSITSGDNSITTLTQAGVYVDNGASSNAVTADFDYFDTANATANLNVTGSTTTAGLTDTITSSVAFLIQDASSNVLLTANTSTQQIVIGSGGNTITLSASGITLAGTARHAKTIVLTPEYANTVLDASQDGTCSSASTGTMTSGYDGTENFYQWTTTTVTPSQCYDVVVKIPIPSDFDWWDLTNAPTIDTNTSSTANATAVITLTDTAGAIVTGYNAVTVSSGTTANSWQTYSGTLMSGGTFTPGGVATLKIRMTSLNNATIKVGAITFHYMSKY